MPLSTVLGRFSSSGQTVSAFVNRLRVNPPGCAAGSRMPHGSLQEDKNRKRKSDTETDEDERKNTCSHFNLITYSIRAAKGANAKTHLLLHPLNWLIKIVNRTVSPTTIGVHTSRIGLTRVPFPSSQISQMEVRCRDLSLAFGVDNERIRVK